jgi:hypothetical protein
VRVRQHGRQDRAALRHYGLSGTERGEITFHWFVIGTSYMLMGETGADFDHPAIERPPEGRDWYLVGPHVMFVFPEGAGDLTNGIGNDTSSGEPYVRPFQGAQPLLVVPIALPNEVVHVDRAIG